MSVHDVREVLVRAATDPNFRACFFDDLGKALADYDLTDEERACLREIKSEDCLATTFQEAEKEAGVVFNDTRI